MKPFERKPCSMPQIRTRKSRYHSQFRVKTEQEDSFISLNARDSLPKMRMQRLMTKIGASHDMFKFGSVPSYDKRVQLSKLRWDQLRQEYFPNKEGNEPFEGELDELVIGCWKPGFNSKKAVWKKYREQHCELAYQTSKILLRKR